jgi:hypothetical protein
LIQAFEAWWRTGLGEELLALFIGAHDFLNGKLVFSLYLLDALLIAFIRFSL